MRDPYADHVVERDGKRFRRCGATRVLHRESDDDSEELGDCIECLDTSPEQWGLTTRAELEDLCRKRLTKALRSWDNAWYQYTVDRWQREAARNRRRQSRKTKKRTPSSAKAIQDQQELITSLYHQVLDRFLERPHDMNRIFQIQQVLSRDYGMSPEKIDRVFQQAQIVATQQAQK